MVRFSFLLALALCAMLLNACGRMAVSPDEESSSSQFGSSSSLALSSSSSKGQAMSSSSSAPGAAQILLSLLSSATSQQLALLSSAGVATGQVPEGYSESPNAKLGALTVTGISTGSAAPAPYFVLNGPDGFVYESLAHSGNGSASQTWNPGEAIASGSYTLALYNSNSGDDLLLATHAFTLSDTLFAQYAKTFTSGRVTVALDWIYPANVLAEVLYDLLRSQNIALNAQSAPALTSTALADLQTPDEVLASKTANTAELALLYAALLERCGLYPLLLWTSESVYVGWYTYSDKGGAEFLDISILASAGFSTANAQGNTRYTELASQATSVLLDIDKLRSQPY